MKNQIAGKSKVKWGDDAILKLKPCPFCGCGRLEFEFESFKGKMTPQIHCLGCGVIVRGVINDHSNMDSLLLVDNWNNRLEWEVIEWEVIE